MKYLIPDKRQASYIDRRSTQPQYSIKPKPNPKQGPNLELSLRGKNAKENGLKR